MTKMRDYFKKKYDKKNSPAFLQGVLRTLGVPHEDPETEEPKAGDVVEK